HRMQRSTKKRLETWAVLVIASTFGLLVTMGFNTFECFALAIGGMSPAFPPIFDNIFLALSIWGFPIPIAWGFTAHWMPAFLGLKPLRSKLAIGALLAVVAGLAAAIAHAFLASSIILLGSAILITTALRIFEPTEKPAKTQGVHKSFPVFMRTAYVWLLIASLLLVWANLQPASSGIGG